MKRICVLLAVLLVFLLAACGPAEEAPPAAPETVAAAPETGTAAPDTPVAATRDLAYPAPAQDGYPAPDSYPAPADAPSALTSAALSQFDGRVVFHSSRNGGLQLFLLDGQSGDVDYIPTGAAQAYEPQWSPDCSSILYTHEAEYGADSEIHVVDPAGQRTVPFLKEARPETLEWAPMWAPSGERMAYQTNANQLINICFADSDGADLGCLEQNDFSNAHPSWSPDGSQLLFVSNRDGPWNIYIKDQDDPEAVALSDTRAIDFHPRFSPDGSTIVFESDRSGNSDIYIMNPDGSGARPLAVHAADDVDPFWTGDDQIVFASERSGDWELYLVNLDGSDPARLTINPMADKGPAWCLAE